MASGDLITAARYNSAQSRVQAVLGTGSGDEGYGQTVSSSIVNSSNKVTAQDVNNLFEDIKKIRVHQTGGIPNSISQIAVGDIVGDTESAVSVNVTFDPATNTYTTTNVGSMPTKGFADYEAIITTLETPGQRFLLASTQSTTDVDAEVDQRRNQWTAPIDTEFKITFTDADHRRHFFNSGGSLTVVSSLSNPPTSGDSVAKSQDWQNILSNSGTVSFNYNETTTSGTGVVQSIGNYDLTTSYQEIFRKSATGVYGNNNYYIRAKEIDSKTIQIQIEYYDHNPGGYKIDEPIQGLLEAKMGYVRASGIHVDVDAPSFAVVNSLA